MAHAGLFIWRPCVYLMQVCLIDVSYLIFGHRTYFTCIQINEHQFNGSTSIRVERTTTPLQSILTKWSNMSSLEYNDCPRVIFKYLRNISKQGFITSCARMIAYSLYLLFSLRYSIQYRILLRSKQKYA